MSNPSTIVLNARAIAAIDAHVADKGSAALEVFRSEFGACDVATYKAKRAEWVAAYNAARKTEHGAKRFSEIVRAAGVTKPQTEKARKAQAARKAAGGKAGTAADKRTRASKNQAAIAASAVKAGSGAASGRTVKMDLTAIEAHLIGLIRAGKFVQAAQCVADMAEKA